MRRLYLLFVACIWTSLLFSQISQPFFHHFTAKDGLPSSEVYYVMQDSEGFVWFGTDNGVARFDGYEFKVYGISEGLTDVVAFTILEDDAGKIWVSTFSGRIFYLEKDRFVPYQHNDKLIEIRAKQTFTKLVDVTPDEEMIFYVDRGFFKKVDSTGNVTQPFHYSNQNAVNIHLRQDKYGNLEQYGLSNFSNLNTPKSSKSIPKSLPLIIHERERSDTIFSFSSLDIASLYNRTVYGNYTVVGVTEPDEHNLRDIIAIVQDQIIFVDGAKNPYRIKHKTNNNNALLPHHDTGFWMAMDRGEGLLHLYLKKDTLSGKQELQLDTTLSGHSISYLRYDRAGGLWICTRDAGVFYSSNPRQNTYSDPTGQNSTPLSLQLIDANTYLAGYENRKIVLHNVIDGTHETTKTPSTFVLNMHSLKYVPKTGEVYSSLGHFNIKNDLKGNEAVTQHFENQSNYCRYLGYDPYVEDDQIYFVYLSSFGIIDVTKEEIVEIFSWSQDLRKYGQSFGKDHSGKLLLGTMEGLFEVLPDGSLVANDLGFEALQGRVISINALINGGTLFGTRGSGLVFYGSEGSRLINETDGLVSDIVRQVHQSADGSIWVATLSGLSKLKLDKDGSIIELRSFQLQHGLPSKEIYSVHSLGNDVWLATGGGIVDFKEPDIPKEQPPVFIRSITVDGLFRSPDSIFFKSGQKNLKINFGTINYQMLGRIPYRYRINQDETWLYTTNRTVEYPNLSTGFYQFEIQSQNQEKRWSKSTFLNFEIPAQWYERWQTRLLGLLLLVLFIGGVFKYQEKSKQRKLAFLEQIDDLERAAVQAQMNPHFVFNSLNSIQYFILQHETKQAVYYLSRFARLIRQTLHSSMAGVHTLQEEINTLETYLSLEKLRFKERFDYQISIDANLSRDRISIPPLLIQPYVENAIIHGLAEIDEGGLISISFSGTAEELIVEVEDNGIGFDESKIGRDSVGMGITKRRLELLTSRKSRDREHITIKTKSDPQGKVAGTIITLRIITR